MPYLRKSALRMMVICTLVTVAACGEHDTGVSDANAATTRNANASYELTTISRPVSLEKEFAPVRGVYEMCVGFAEARKLPYKPFPQIPKDYVLSRHTWISDGERYIEREERSVTDVSKTQPETGCEVRLTTTVHESRVQDGKTQDSDLDMNGGYSLSEVRVYYPTELDTAKLALYTTKRTVNGVALKCSPPMPGSGADDPGFCIVDPSMAKGMLMTAAGEPLLAYYIARDTGLHPHDVVVEPVKFNTGRTIAPSAFKLGQK